MSKAEMPVTIALGICQGSVDVDWADAQGFRKHLPNLREGDTLTEGYPPLLGCWHQMGSVESDN